MKCAQLKDIKLGMFERLDVRYTREKGLVKEKKKERQGQREIDRLRQGNFDHLDRHAIMYDACLDLTPDFSLYVSLLLLRYCPHYQSIYSFLFFFFF